MERILAGMVGFKGENIGMGEVETGGILRRGLIGGLGIKPNQRAAVIGCVGRQQALI